MEVVLVHPQIPQNTGSIARTCAATNTFLHLIEPMAFEISEKQVRRAGLDYWPEVKLKQHKSYEEFKESNKEKNFWYFSTHAKKNYYQANFSSEDVLVFGSETKGVGKEFISKLDPEELLLIPMLNNNVRSLNLSNAVNIVLYHALVHTKLI